MTTKAGTRRLNGLGNRCEVKAWIPPENIMTIAGERVDGMVNYYLSASRKTSLHDGLKDLDMLARSCYLQGMNDILDVIAKGEVAK